MENTTLNLYTFKPSANTICDDEIDKSNFFLQGVLEALQDNTKSKFACFLELKREQNLLLEKLKHDLINNNNGNFYRNHVLLDVLNLYKLYCEEFTEEETAFDGEVIKLCYNMVLVLFELFSCTTNIVVFVKSTANYDDIIARALQSLQELGYITIIKTVSLP
ncbi:PrGVORF77 [Pieris rapae granulovirus Wuhan]|uniref:PrGVORF77 n=1 Tax=Pieris rapae granulovirus Wuhan TaxID=2848030 RepID=D2J4P4_9BBAC|nr:PrGVORF77 [Betabaculovirus arrapae]ACZ63563.1 PrGVORF77 [Betabaculovirus arrapae]ADO85506.1 unknown [Pieris rapae granulovirus]UOS85751.1 ORF77 [Pieris rapae granulovirus]